MVGTILKVCLFIFLAGLVWLLINGVIIIILEDTDCPDVLYDILVKIEFAVAISEGVNMSVVFIIGLVCLFKAMFL